MAKTGRNLPQMLRKQASQSSPQTNLFRPLLLDFINTKNELVILSQQVNWSRIEGELAQYYTNFGAPAKPIRLMAGLLILKQMFNKSDEVIVEVKQNPYYQFFTGSSHFEWDFPCDPTDLVYFRKRIGEDGVKVIFSSSLELHQKKIDQAKELIVDTTVQEKNITFPTDTKLTVKIIDKTLAFAEKNGIKLKQTFAKELKALKIQLRFSHHPRRKKQARKAFKRIKTIAGKLVREVSRKQENNEFDQLKDFFLKVLAQTRHSKDKTYSLHEPEVSCIAKGKSHKPYEFGSKTSIAILPGMNVVVNVSCFKGNPHDSKTLEPVLEQIKDQINKEFQFAIVDRGFRGKSKIGKTEVVIPGPEKDREKSLAYQENKSRQCKSRAAIEPIISHLKHDHRMFRNYLKGFTGDKINAILAGAAFNFKIRLREIRSNLFYPFFETEFSQIFVKIKETFCQINLIFKSPKLAC